MCSADSPGRSISNNNILIFDLDGTILSINSFPAWVKYILFGKFPGMKTAARARLSLYAAVILAERKLLRCDHSRTKRRLQKLWAEAVEKHNGQLGRDLFLQQLIVHIRPQMKGILAHVKAGQVEAILATAAAGEYGRELGKRLGFRHIITTPFYNETPYAQNSREEKRDRTLAFLNAQGLDKRKRIFFTDHEEDTALIKESQSVLWFGSDAEAKEIGASLQGIAITPCLGFDAEQLMDAIIQYTNE